MVHMCPFCKLRFHFASEVDLHVREDHRAGEVDETDETITKYPPPTRPVHGTFFDRPARG